MPNNNEKDKKGESGNKAERVHIEGLENIETPEGEAKFTEAVIQAAVKEAEERKTHTIIIRNVPHHLYVRLHNVKAYYKARSWAQLLDKITEEYEEDIRETEWL